MLKLKKFKNLDEIKQFAPQWRALHETSVRPEISLSPQWLIAWYKTFGAQSCPQVLAVFENDEPVLVAPMYFSAERFRFVELEALRSSANGYSPSGGLLVSAKLNEADQQEATSFLIQNIDVELVRIFKSPMQEAKALKSTLSKDAVCTIGQERVMRTPMIDLRDSWADYFASRSSSHRKSIRRKVKRIEQEPDVEFLSTCPANRDDPVIGEIIETSTRSWKKNHGADLETDSVAREFLLLLVDELGPSGAVKVWMIKIGGQLVAYELHFRYGGKIYPIRADFDHAYTHLSPGLVLLRYVLEALMEDPDAELYDSCADNYDYLKSWAHYTTDFYSVDIFSSKPKSTWVFLAKYRMLPAYRKFAALVSSLSGTSTEQKN